MNPRQLFSLCSSTVSGSFRMGIKLLKLLAVTHCTLEYVADAVVCSGPSMEPTIKTNDIILCEHFSAHLGKFNRNDIIVSRSPTNPKHFICKRVVGIAGDTIMTSTGSQIMIPKGHVWIEGDNSYNSSDSRTFGSIPVGLIRGRALFKVWPLTDATYFLSSKNNPLRNELS